MYPNRTVPNRTFVSRITEGTTCPFYLTKKKTVDRTTSYLTSVNLTMSLRFLPATEIKPLLIHAICLCAFCKVNSLQERN